MILVLKILAMIFAWSIITYCIWGYVHRRKNRNKPPLIVKTEGKKSRRHTSSLPPLVVFLFLLIPAKAFSDSPAQVYDFPTGKTLTVDGVEYMAFTLDQYKTLNLVYSDYRWLWERKAIFERQAALYESMQGTYELRINGFEDEVKALQADRAYWQTRVSEEADRANKAEKMGKVERFGLWGLVVVEAVVIGTLGVKSWVAAH